MNRTAKIPDAFNTIILGGLVAGVLDAVNAVIAYGILGMNPVQVLQYVASGILGNSAYAGLTATGFANAGLGAALHFFIALVVATVYYAGALKLPVLAAFRLLPGSCPERARFYS
jgi:hypothetical protein